MEPRPKLKIALTSTDKLMEIIGWLVLALLWGLVLLNYAKLPDNIPIHFNASGQADNYGSKATIFMLPVICTVVFIIMTLLNRVPHVFNYSTNITADNAERLYTGSTRMMRYLKLIIALIFTWIVFKTLQTAEGPSSGLGTWFLPLALGLILIPVAFFIIRSFRSK